jgi:DDE superfamily endonuclease
MNSITDIIPKVASKSQQKFLIILFSTIMVICGKVNFTNLSRYSEITERTYRRQFARSYNFIKGNAEIIEKAIAPTARQIIATDCSFIGKSGKATYGIEYFYNGSAGKAEKGLEISVIAIVDVDSKQGYALSVQQTPPAQPESKKTRIDWYLEQLAATKPYLPKSVHHVVSDGFYSKIKWVDGVTAMGLEAIGKLRCDADIRHVYTGEQKPRGRRRKYDGKVDLADLSRMTLVSEIEPQLYLYTVEVWVVSMKRKVRLVYIRDCRNPNRLGVALLFSTDINLDASEILCFYKSRFQIEFIFRDAKQFTGLTDCQARDLTKLDFHFNSSLMALNLSKFDAWRFHHSVHPLKPFVFSMASYKRLALNRHLLDRFISLLDLDHTLIKSHPNFQKLCSYGSISG